MFQIFFSELLAKQLVLLINFNFDWRSLVDCIFRYEKAVIAMAKQSVTLEVLSYHASASLEDALRLRVSNNKRDLTMGRPSMILRRFRKSVFDIYI